MDAADRSNTRGTRASRDIQRNGPQWYRCWIDASFSTLTLRLVSADGFIQYKEFRDYFGDDLLTGEANTVELTALFNEIDVDRSGSITFAQLLAYFNRHATMISEDETHVFLGMVSDIGDENNISLKGTDESAASILSTISSRLEFIKAMQEWKV